jgi:protein subunit release factor B
MKPAIPLPLFNESEIEETFARSSGKGGQNVNKVSTKVILRHLPTNITVTVQDSRSQAANRQLARERLMEALIQRKKEAQRAILDRIEKARRQKIKRPKGVKERILADKKRRSITKDARKFRGDLCLEC